MTPLVKLAVPLGIVVSFVCAALFVALRLLQRTLRRGGLCAPNFPLTRKLFPALCGLTLVAAVRFASAALSHPIQQLLLPLSVALIWMTAYVFVRCVWVVTQLVYARFDMAGDDNLRSRRVRTQLVFVEKLAYSGVVFLALCATLLLFDGARSFGNSLLASAGVAGIIMGLAAQKSLGNLFAGFQIAFTQPLRLEDAVVVEGEWGWVEEINLTYVVIRIWDQRRLVLPITYFVEKPFQNWTRTTAQILGAVTLEVSHRVPLNALETELFRLLDGSPLWDKDKRVLQMIECSERSVTLRALMTAKDSPTCWDLRCAVRRGLVEFLQREHPESLPVVRLEGPAGLGALTGAVRSEDAGTRPSAV